MTAKTPKTIGRQAIRETLKEVPIESVLLLGKSELTTKQKEFARNVAMGETGAESYRKAYNSKGKKKTQGDNASRLKADSRIQAEIDAYKLAIQAETYRSAAGLRSLVLHSLTQVLIDPATKPAQKIQAARVLGQVTEVAAFTEVKQITHVNGSDEIKAQIMNQLKGLMLSAGQSGDVVDVTANELLEELASTGDDFADVEPYPTPTDPTANDAEPAPIHTIPPKVSPNIAEKEINSLQSDLSADIGTHPHVFPNEDGEGGI
jgi:hypothetical protein